MNPFNPPLPETPEEWERARRAAEYLLDLDAAVRFGLLACRDAINPDRCRLILESLPPKPNPTTPHASIPDIHSPSLRPPY